MILKQWFKEKSPKKTGFFARMTVKTPLLRQ